MSYQAKETLGPVTFTAGEEMAAYRRVKLKSGSTTTPLEVEYADAGEDFIGITQHNVESGDPIAVAPLTREGTFMLTAAGAFAALASIYGANDGKVDDVSSGTAFFKALEAATADGDIVECILHPHVSTTATTVSIADSDGFTEATTAEAALAELYQNAVTAQATVPIPLGAITMEDGTSLTKQATTVAGIAQLANKEQVILIPIDCSSGESLGFSVAMPQDMDEAAPVTVHVLAGKDADNDTLTLDCEVYPVGAGDVANADIQDTAAQAIVAAVTELTFTCGADGLIAAPSALSVVLALGGTNDGDATYIYAVWLEYTRKILTA